MDITLAVLIGAVLIFCVAIVIVIVSVVKQNKRARAEIEKAKELAVIEQTDKESAPLESVQEETAEQGGVETEPVTVQEAVSTEDLIEIEEPVQNEREIIVIEEEIALSLPKAKEKEVKTEEVIEEFVLGEQTKNTIPKEEIISLPPVVRNDFTDDELITISREETPEEKKNRKPFISGRLIINDPDLDE